TASEVSQPNRIVRNSSCGRYFPNATGETVIGVEINSPTGPQSAVQKTTETITANGVMPVCEPYSMGSIRYAVASSITKSTARTYNPCFQSLNAPSVNKTGRPMPIIGPIYGAKRSRPASRPQMNGFGTPNKLRPMPTTNP